MVDMYEQLARHLENLTMGFPYNDALPKLLEDMFSPEEAQAALAFPTTVHPLELTELETIVSNCRLPREQVIQALEAMYHRHVIFSAPTVGGSMGYALLQVGFGIPQTFFWGGERTEYAKKMAGRILNYFSIPTTGEVYGGVKTKSYKYIPTALAVKIPMQEVHPNEQMESIVGATELIAVAHCPCRMSAQLLGRTDCTHSLEVCLKYDELAEFVISKGLARPLSKDEALHILEDSEKEGMVHMTDNAQGGHKHTCNCCGHYCWNVGIINRRKIPRDQLMAVYHIRQTEEDQCLGCGACEEICPVKAITMQDGVAKVDTDWCIGCGVCAVKCPAEVISIVRRREDRPPETFEILHDNIRMERGL